MPTPSPCEAATAALAANTACSAAQNRISEALSGGNPLTDSDTDIICAQTCRSLLTNFVNQCTDPGVSSSTTAHV